MHNAQIKEKMTQLPFETMIISRTAYQIAHMEIEWMRTSSYNFQRKYTQRKHIVVQIENII